MTGEEELVERFMSLARGEVGDLLAFLPPFEEAVAVEGTRATVRTHFISHDANGAAAVTALAQMMSHAALDFCVPRARIARAAEALRLTGATTSLVSLMTEARDLFAKATTSGEGGELLLFLLMERLLKRPQILSKMSLKTNSQVHVHGSDGIHAALGDDGILDVYWGESKLYESSSDAFKDCFESIAPFLRADGDDRRKRDLLLVRDHLNVNEKQLVARLLEYFDETNPKRLQVRWNGVCLVGFSRSSYPNLATLTEAQLGELRSAVRRWTKTTKNRLEEFEIMEVCIDVFCIPVPSVTALREAVLREIVGQA